MRGAAAVLTLSMIAAPDVAGAQRQATGPVPLPPSNYVTPSYNPTGASDAHEVAARQFRARLKQLRDEGLRLRAADGGTLTQEHERLIQGKLDAIQAAYAPYSRTP